jgi:hypothetical protein
MFETVPSVKSGSLALAYSWKDGEPGSDFIELVSWHLSDGILSIHSLENRLEVSIFSGEFGKGKLSDRRLTPELVRDVSAPVIIFISWSEEKITKFFLNGLPVSESPTEGPLRISEPIGRFEEGVRSHSDKDIEDFFDKPEIISMLPGEFRHLIQFRKRLACHLSRTHAGDYRAVLDMAVCLRVMFCGSTSNGGRLLFRCGALVGHRPICFVGSGIHEIAPPDFILERGGVIFGQIARPHPSRELAREIDLIDWLEMPALTGKSVVFRNWQLIKEVADMSSVHADKLNSSALSSFISLHRVDIDFNFLNIIFIAYARLAIGCADNLLSTYKDNFSGV